MPMRQLVFTSMHREYARSRWITVLVVLLLVVLVGCAGNESSSPTPTPLPTPRAQRIVQENAEPALVLISIPGIHADTISDLRTRSPSPIPTINQLTERGRQSILRPVQPPLPAPSAASLATGELPADHGALSAALDSGVLADQTLWQLAEEQGKTTAVIGWPHVTDPPQPSIWVAQTGRYAEPARHEIPLSPVYDATWPNAPESVSPPAEGRIALRRADREVGAVWILALDTTDDDSAAYDTFLLDLDRSVGPETAWLHTDAPSQWTSLRLSDNAGADFKLLSATNEQVVLYQSEAPIFTVVPARLGQTVDTQFGFYPPDADQRAYAAGWITSEDLLRMAGRQTQWLADVAALVWRRQTPDVLMTQWPVVAQVTPQLFLVDSAQPGWQPQQENDLGDVRRRAHAAADDALGTLVPELDLSRTSLLAASPYGYSPVHTQIDLVALLEQWELLTVSPDGTPNWAEAPVRVTVEDGIAWLWPAPSVESPDEFLAERRTSFQALTDPLTGQAPVAQILTGEELAEQALLREVTRDAMFVQLRPGYRFALGDGENPFEHTTRYGAAGYAPATPAMRGWLLAAGWHIRPTAGDDTPRVVDVPATAATLLDLDWPLRHGSPLDEWLDLP